jgi:hypothetical protein
MKIGLSYSRCVRDIVEGVVDIDDVLIIIARTDFDPNNDTQWKGIWNGYCAGSIFNTNMEWSGYEHDNPEHEQQFRNVTQRLYDQGKLHQPRQFGAYPRRLPHIWLETVLPSEDLDANPTLKAAWNKFQTLAQLTGTELDDEHTA